MAINYLFNWSDVSKPQFSVNAGTIDSNSTSLSLAGVGALNWGQGLQQNLLHMLENFSSSIAPQNPTFGQLWHNSTQNIGRLNINIGGTWQELAFRRIDSPTQPAGIVYSGDTWYDTVNHVFNVYNSISNIWSPISAGGGGGGGGGGTGGLSTVGITGVNIGVTGSPLTANGSITLTLNNFNVVAALGFNPANMSGSTTQVFQAANAPVSLPVTLPNPNAVITAQQAFGIAQDNTFIQGGGVQNGVTISNPDLHKAVHYTFYCAPSLGSSVNMYIDGVAQFTGLATANVSTIFTIPAVLAPTETVMFSWTGTVVWSVATFA